jgi:hypothetical protein
LKGQEETLAALNTGERQGWGLSDIHFLSGDAVGRAMFDTGAARSFVSASYVKKAGLKVHKFAPGAEPRAVRLPDGSKVYPIGVVHLEMSIQLMLEVDDPTVLVHWDRRVLLESVWVLPFGDSAPRDLYVSYEDWRPRQGDETDSPLGSLYKLVMGGARVIDSPRTPPAGTVPTNIVLERTVSGDMTLAAMELTNDELEAAIIARIAPEMRDTAGRVTSSRASWRGERCLAR